MKGRFNKNLNRLWAATEERRVYPAHWEQEDEVLKAAKPISGKSMRQLLAGSNYSSLEAEDGSRCWYFAERPKFAASERYYIELVHELDKPDYLFVRRAG